MVQASPFLQRIAVRRTHEPGVFEGMLPPLSMGNVRPIAYGGFAIATAIVAAGHTIPTHTRFVPYSILGHFLGPGSIDVPFVCQVSSIRDTRTFVTRSVIVKQRVRGKHGEAQLRNVLSITLDMIASPRSEPAYMEEAKKHHVDVSCVGSLLRYDPAPSWKIDEPNEHSETPDTYFSRRLQEGTLEKQSMAIYNKIIGLWHQIFDTVPVPSSMMLQNLLGMVKIPTSQDHLTITDRRSFDWMRIHDALPCATGTEPAHGTSETKDMLPISPVMAHAATMAFALDGALAFAPLSLGKKSMLDASAASTLDFATRFHSDVLDMNQYLLREIRPIQAGWQRTYSEARLFDTNGHLVATCTQQGVLRPVQEGAMATPADPPHYAPTPKL